MTQPIKIYGLHRTGTNLAAFLLRNNFSVDILNNGRVNGWKHGRMPADAWTADAKFALCVRHPLAQAYSNYRYFHRSYGFDSTMPGLFRPDTLFAEFLDQPLFEFAEPFDRWNRLYRHWIDCLPADRRIIIRQEDQLAHQEWALENMQRKLGLERTGEQWTTTAEHVDVGEKPRGIIEQPVDFLDAYTPGMLDVFNNRIDQKLLERFGYPLIPPRNGVSFQQDPKPQSVSFIVITDGKRPELLRLCIASLKLQSANLKTEIIVAGETSGLPADVKAVDAKEAAAAGQLGAMRNAGAAQTTGDILIFLDDDILLPSIWLKQLEYYCHDTWSTWSLLGVRLIGPDGERMYEPRSFVTGGAAIIRRTLFDKLQWNPTITFHSYREGKGSNEDCEYTQRVRQSGYGIAFDPVNFAWHAQGEGTCPAFEEVKARLTRIK